MQRDSAVGWRTLILIALLMITTTFFLVIVNTIQSDNTKKTIDNLLRPEEETYDYIVVGGGAAGCVVAEKLSRNGQHRVLLLEAGGRADDDPRISTLGPITSELEHEFYGEFFWQSPQIASEVIPQSLNHQTTTGRLLGGGSSVNGMQYVRGTNWLYKRWYNLTQDPIWNTPNVISHFKRLETYTSVAGPVDPTHRGYSGRMGVTDEFLQTMGSTPMAEKLVGAYEQMLGLPRLSDYNRLTPASETGPFLRWQLQAFPDATRSSSSRAFLTPDVMRRPNLVLSLHSYVTKVLFNSYRHATGVSYLKDNTIHRATARKRIIMSAGVFTPTILQLSGIGNASHLTSVGIPIIFDNPNVGKVIYNQQVTAAVFAKNLSDLPSVNTADIYEGGAFLPNPASPSLDTMPTSNRRIQIIGINTGPVMVVAVINTQPLSPGYIRIRDSDPLSVAESSDRIFVQPGGGEVDLEVSTQAIYKYACGLHREFQGTGVGPAIDTSYVLIQPSLALCSNLTLLKKWVQDNTNAHAHHWTSSCRMGVANDGISVTNSKGSVWGVTGLSIADDSVMPVNADGNTVAPAFLIGDIISDTILAGQF